MCHKGTKLFVDERREGAGIHVLVIGVSQYAAKTRSGRTNFGDIEGTAVGAARFAEFMSKKFHDPGGLSVQTIRLLLSPTPHETPMPDRDTWVEASSENVRTALNSWYEDCNRHPGNIAVFYIGGHGLVTTEAASEVFLSDANRHEDPHLAGVNMTVTEESMKFCQAVAGIFFYDCCAGFEVPRFFRQADGIFPAVVIQEGQTGSAKMPLRITAARTGHPAYAIGAEEGTIFSWALLDALQTAGQIVDAGYFAITRYRLEKYLPAKMKSHHLLSAEESSLANVNGDYLIGEISRPDPPPEVNVSFVRQGGPVIPVPLLIKEEPKSGNYEWSEVMVGETEETKVPAGTYHVQSGNGASNWSEQKLDQDTRYYVVDGNLLRQLH